MYIIFHISKLFFLYCLFLILSSTSVFAKNVNLVLQVKFKSGEARIQQTETQVISNLKSVISTYSSPHIFVLGHTDSLGAEDMNQKLSEARAETIYNNIASQDSKGLNFIIEGMGEIAPIADNSTSQGRSKNRRVVVILTGLGDEKTKLIKEKLANSKGLTILEDENPIVNKFVYNEIKKHQKKDARENENINDRTEVDIITKSTLTKKETKFRYSVASGAYYNLIEAEDRDNSRANAQWVSELNIPIGVSAQFSLFNLWLGLKIFGHKQDYKVENSPNYVWDEKNPFLLRGSLIGDYEIKKFGFGFDVDFNQESSIFENGGNVRLEKELFIGLSSRLKYKWFAGKNWSSRVGGKLSYPLLVNSDIDSRGELGYILELDLRKDDFFNTHSFTIKAYYGFKNLSNKQNDQQEELLGLMLSLDSLLWL